MMGVTVLPCVLSQAFLIKKSKYDAGFSGTKYGQNRVYQSIKVLLGSVRWHKHALIVANSIVCPYCMLVALCKKSLGYISIEEQGLVQIGRWTPHPSLLLRPQTSLAA